MSASSDLQSAIADLLQASEALPPSTPIVLRSSDIEDALANTSVCLYVMPALATHALQGAPFVFFDRYEVRVRIIEQPASNTLGADAYDLVDAVAIALHWQNPDGILAHPMQISSKPAEVIEDPANRVIDVIFEAQLQINPQ